ncbi:MAG: endonuclease domain-containing protein [Acidiferrobacterales bacterium]
MAAQRRSNSSSRCGIIKSPDSTRPARRPTATRVSNKGITMRPIRMRFRDLPRAVRQHLRKQTQPETSAMVVPLVLTHRRRVRSGPTPHDILWTEVHRRWPEAQREHLLIAGRKIRGDIAFPESRLVVEVDGWEHHGRYVSDFRRDRDRQNLLTLAGWRILRIPAGDIHLDLSACCLLIAMALDPG